MTYKSIYGIHQYMGEYMLNPEIVYAERGGYWSHVDVNDVISA
jgi:hypothetical protein